MLQKVIDYEFQIVQQKINSSYPYHSSPTNSSRYSSWRLDQKVKKIPQYYDYSLVWIGNHKYAHISSFFYCILSGSLQTTEKKDQAFMKLKYYLYKLCQEFLPLEEQKFFVQNICLLQYSKTISEFLRKTYVFEEMFIKMFLEFKKQNPSSAIDDEFNPIEDLKLLGQIFQFLNVQILEEKITKVALKNSFFYVLEEAECYFVLEEKNLSPVRRILTESNEQLIYETYRKRSSKKNKMMSSPQSPKGFESPQKNQQNKNYKTPKFFSKSSNVQVTKQTSPKGINVQAFKEDSIKKEKKDDFGIQNSFVKLIKISDPKSDVSPKSRAKSPIFDEDPENTKGLSAKNRIKSKENYQNQQNVVKQFGKREKTIFHSLGINETNFRSSIPLRPSQPKEKRSVPKFILQKQKNSPSISPQNKDRKLKTNAAKIAQKPIINAKVHVNHSILASPFQKPYLYTPYQQK